ncbi:MAG TPA: DUF1003 domain-containing protein [Stellaceae bacterium]|jgi:uncharacterized membrane protein|nr:DUF1003 domain-containing protein [Stellaceae bacterium]
MRPHKSWHDLHLERLPSGARVADTVAGFIGSWQFIIIQSVIFVIWVIVNTLWLFEGYQWDPYPFILFNLFMSAEAAYSSPLILMSQNRQAERDREQAQHDYDTNIAAKEEIEMVLRELGRLELDKLDKIMELLQEMRKVGAAPAAVSSGEGSP